MKLSRSSFYHKLKDKGQVELQRQFGMAIIFITHDFGIILTICDRVAVMYAGKIVETAFTREIFDNPAHCSGLGGSLTGCRFAPRRAKSTRRCVDEEPPFIGMRNGHRVSCWYPKEAS